MGFISEPHILKKIWHFFNLAFDPPAHLNTFCYVVLCESLLNLDSVWIQLKAILERTNEKDPTLESLRSDFFGLRATESRTVSTFSGNLAVNFLPLVENCPFLVDLINVPMFLNFCNLELIWNVIEIKPLTVSCLDSLQGFCPQIEGYTKCFFFHWPCHLLEWFWDVILLSINPEKYWIISLILVELLTSKWITFILKHPVDNWFDHFWLGFKSLINIFLLLINFCSILLVNITINKN